MESRHKKLTWPSLLDPFDICLLVFYIAFESAYHILHSSMMLMTVTASILFLWSLRLRHLACPLLGLYGHESIATGLASVPDLFVYNVRHVQDDYGILPCEWTLDIAHSCLFILRFIKYRCSLVLVSNK
jgi:hypothetical protein